MLLPRFQIVRRAHGAVPSGHEDDVDTLPDEKNRLDHLTLFDLIHINLFQFAPLWLAV